MTRATYTHLSDEALVVRLPGRDTRAFDELYGRYSRRLYGYLYRMLGGDVARAEELLQDVFLKVFEQASAFDPSRTFSAWVFAVAANSCRNEYRHRDVVERAHRHLASESVPTEGNIDARLDLERFRVGVFEELGNLSEEMRSAFLLRHQQDLTIGEIAGVLGCPVGTVKSRLHNATRILAERLGHMHPDRERKECEYPTDV